MVKVTYDNSTLVEKMVPGDTITLRGHSFVMPGNIEIITDAKYLKPEGTEIIRINGVYDIKDKEKVDVQVMGVDNIPFYNGSFTMK